MSPFSGIFYYERNIWYLFQLEFVNFIRRSANVSSATIENNYFIVIHLCQMFFSFFFLLFPLDITMRIPRQNSFYIPKSLVYLSVDATWI